jgi:hypothetical protein
MAGICNEIVGERRLKGLLVRFATVWLVASGLATAQEAAETKPKVSNIPLTAEQLAVYRVVLHSWMENEVSAINLTIQTVP